MIPAVYAVVIGLIAGAVVVGVAYRYILFKLPSDTYPPSDGTDDRATTPRESSKDGQVPIPPGPAPSASSTTAGGDQGYLDGLPHKVHSASSAPPADHTTSPGAGTAAGFPVVAAADGALSGEDATASGGDPTSGEATAAALPSASTDVGDEGSPPRDATSPEAEGMSDELSYGLVLNLDALDREYSAAEGRAWAAGCYCGEIWELLKTHPGRSVREPVNPRVIDDGPSAEILLRMAEATNRSFRIEPSKWFQDWQDVVFGPSAGLPDWIVGVNERRASADGES